MRAALYFQYGTLFWRSSCGRWKSKKVYLVSSYPFKMILIPLIRAEPIWLNHPLEKSPPLHIMELSLGFHLVNLGITYTQATATHFCPSSAWTRVHTGSAWLWLERSSVFAPCLSVSAGSLTLPPPQPPLPPVLPHGPWVDALRFNSFPPALKHLEISQFFNDYAKGGNMLQLVSSCV